MPDERCVLLLVDRHRHVQPGERGGPSGSALVEVQRQRVRRIARGHHRVIVGGVRDPRELHA